MIEKKTCVCEKFSEFFFSCYHHRRCRLAFTQNKINNSKFVTVSPVVAVASTTCSLEGMMMVVNESEIINNLKSTRRPRRKEQEENLSSKDF